MFQNNVSPKDVTKFSWKIENLNCVEEMVLTSPTFCYNSVMWKVGMKKSSVREGKDFEISLHQLECEPAYETYCCSLAFHDYDASLIWKCRKSFDSNLRVSQLIRLGNFIKKGEVFISGQPEILSKKTLTVHCLISRSSKDLLQPSKCFARTEIAPNADIGEETFIWKIENAKSFKLPQTRVEAFGRNGETYSIKLSLTNNNKFQVSFTALLLFNLKFKMSVLDNTGEKFQFLNDECFFEGKEEEFNFNTNLNKALLISKADQFLPQGTLSLHFTCKTSKNVTFHGTVSENEFLDNKPQPSRIPVVSQANSLHQDLRDTFEHGYLSDCIIRTEIPEIKDFHLHKAIIGARSEKLLDYFYDNPDSDRLILQDVDEHTGRRLLQFIYTDVVGQMTWESALKLYAAAAKYGVRALRRRCSAILRSELCVSSVLDVLKLADAHKDKDLKSAALEFVSRLDSEIVGSENWLRFEEENAILAAEALRKLYRQKIDG